MILKELTSITGVNMSIGPVVDYETKFDGVNENITVPSTPSINFDTTDTFSISFWYRPYSVTGTRYLFEKRVTSGAFNGYMMILLNNLLRIILRSGGGAAEAIYINLTTPLVIYNEYNIIVSYDGLATATSLVVTINGVDQAYTVVQSGIGAGMANTQPLYIGGNTSTALGRIDEFAIFNQVLSPTNKAIIYAQTKYNTDYLSIPGIVSHFKMDTLNPLDELGNNTSTSNNMDGTNIIQI